MSYLRSLAFATLLSLPVVFLCVSADAEDHQQGSWSSWTSSSLGNGKCVKSRSRTCSCGAVETESETYACK